MAHGGAAGGPRRGEGAVGPEREGGANGSVGLQRGEPGGGSLAHLSAVAEGMWRAAPQQPLLRGGALVAERPGSRARLLRLRSAAEAAVPALLHPAGRGECNRPRGRTFLKIFVAEASEHFLHVFFYINLSKENMQGFNKSVKATSVFLNILDI